VLVERTDEALLRRCPPVTGDEVGAEEREDERRVVRPEEPPRRVPLTKHLDLVELHRSPPRLRHGRSGHRQVQVRHGLWPFAEPVTTTDEEVLTSHIPALSA
jgi:hypothetical protein